MAEKLKISIKAGRREKPFVYHATSNSVHTFMNFVSKSYADWKYMNVYNSNGDQVDYWTNPAPGSKDALGFPKVARLPARPYVVPSALLK